MSAAGLRVVAVLALLVATACEAEPPPRTLPLQVVTTVAPITSLAADVGGERVQVTGTVPEQGPTSVPATLAQLADADVVLANGLAVDDPTVALARQAAPPSSRVVQLGPTVLRDAGRPFALPVEDRMLWTDPIWAARYADVIRDTLVAVDPAGAAAYVDNHRDLVRRATELSLALKQDQASLPPARRLLLTSRGSYRQLARTYGWTVLDGAALPGEDRAARVARLVELVRARGVPVVFAQPDDDVLREVASAAGVPVDTSLREVDLPGRPGDPEHSWMGLLRADYRAMLRALGGSTAALDALDVTDPSPDRAEYPQ